MSIIKKQLQQACEQVSGDFQRTHEARELSLPLHRKSIHECSLAIRAVHRGEFVEAMQHIDKSSAILGQLKELLSPFPEVFYAGFVQDAQKEFAEASITYGIVTKGNFPSAQELAIDNAPYLNGMAEAVGELRRHVLDLIRQGRFDEGEKMLDMMDDIFYVLTGIDYPDAITRGLRRSTDLARSCLEKTRGDLAVNRTHYSLENEIKALRELLEKR